MVAATDRGSSSFGFAAASVGVALLWFALWTITCNGLVLAGFHYRTFLYGFVVTTLVCAVTARYFFRQIADNYRQQELEISSGESGFTAMLIFAFVAATIAAATAQRTTSSLPYILGSVICSILIWSLPDRKTPRKPIRVASIGWRLIALFMLLSCIYYFSHRADLDDANFINLAVGAQRTSGAVFQFDTMLGDGPGPIHLPTYKFHAFELLGAVLSSLSGLEPIVVFHLILPMFELALITAVLLLTLAPVAGRDWLAAAFLWVAFLFINENTLGTWGIHGIIRLFEGKAFLVCALVPLVSALTVRWFFRGQHIDLVGLSLSNVCAIGFSANGLYSAPLASAFVAAAIVAANPNSRTVWRRALCLLPTISYPLVIAIVILVFKLAVPSEIIGVTNAARALCFVAGFGLAGHLVLTVLALGSLGFVGTVVARAAAIYVPLTMIIILNPLGWLLFGEVTGNLGFRVFWSLPVASIAALAGLSFLRRLGIRSEPILSITAFFVASAAVLWNAQTSEPLTAISWHLPDLKIVRADYNLARQLAQVSDPSCLILAPERIASWLTTMRHAPYPVFVRELYLVHYRFTMDPSERALRERLRAIVDGAAPTQPPSIEDLAAGRMSIGTIAVDDAAPSRKAAAKLAQVLSLPGPERKGSLLVWTGHCQSRPSSRS